MSRLLLNKPLWRICATAAVAVLGITLLLTGWNTYRKRPTYFVPPETVGGEVEHQPDHVNSDGSGPEHATITTPESVSPDKPAAPTTNDQINDHGLSVDAAANATLGVSQYARDYHL